MNKRIQDLAVKTDVWCDQNYTGDGDFDMYDLVWEQKFAELIVRECADLTRGWEKDMSAEQRIRLEIYREIKDHFGVKE
jgi:hypothetical protein